MSSNNGARNGPGEEDGDGSTPERPQAQTNDWRPLGNDVTQRRRWPWTSKKSPVQHATLVRPKPPTKPGRAVSTSHDNATAQQGLPNQPTAPATYDNEVNSISQNKPNRKRIGTGLDVRTTSVDHSRPDNQPKSTSQNATISREVAAPSRSPGDMSLSTNYKLDKPRSPGLRSPCRTPPSNPDEVEPGASLPAGQPSLAGKLTDRNKVKSESNESSRSFDLEDKINDLLLDAERLVPPESLIRQSSESVDVNSKVFIEHLRELLHDRSVWREKEKKLERELTTLTDQRDQLEEKSQQQEVSYKQGLEKLEQNCESQVKILGEKLRDLTIKRDKCRSDFDKLEKSSKSRIISLEAERKEREQTHLNEINQHKDALRDLTDRNNVDATKWRSFEEAFKTEIDRLKRLSRDQESQRKSLSVELNLLKMEVEKVTKQKDSFSQKLAAAVVTQNDSRAELSELEVRCAKLKAENIQLQHNSIKIQSTLTDNYDRSQSQIENMQASIKALKLQKQQAESEVTSLTGENNALREHQTSAKIQISHLEATVKNLTNRQLRATDEIKSLKETLKKSQEDHFFHRDDAQQLRAYISQAGKQQSPIRDEMIYIRGFRELKTDVESWIARNAKASAAQIFSINQEAHILGTLADSGIHGQKASVYLRTDNRVQRWYRNPSYRIQLVRHIVAAFLFGHVFQPFIVGLPATSPELLSWIIDNDIKSRETRFNEFMSIRQSVGAAAVRYAQQFCEERQEHLIKVLVDVLAILLPTASEGENAKVSKFIKKAIKLKHEMAEEPALYQCYWLDGCDSYDDELVDIEGAENGAISICTFPGLARTTANSEDGECVARLVKARALLQGAFLF